MERIIKFRALEVGSNEWVYGYYCKDYVGISYITTLDGVDTSQVTPESVGQLHNGLSRKAKTEVFIGDKIIFDLEAGLGQPLRNRQIGVVRDIEFDYSYYTNVSVIGNIYEESEVKNG